MAIRAKKTKPSKISLVRQYLTENPDALEEPTNEIADRFNIAPTSVSTEKAKMKKRGRFSKNLPETNSNFTLEDLKIAAKAVRDIGDATKLKELVGILEAIK